MTIDIARKQHWQDNSGNEYDEEFIIKELDGYVNTGGMKQMTRLPGND